jgi:hypothetical protein
MKKIEKRLGVGVELLRGLFSVYFLMLLSGCVNVSSQLQPLIDNLRDKVDNFGHSLSKDEFDMALVRDSVPLSLGDEGESLEFRLPEGMSVSHFEELGLNDKHSGLLSRGHFAFREDEGVWVLEFAEKIPEGRYSVSWREGDVRWETSSVEVLSEGVEGSDVVVHLVDILDRHTLEVELENARLSDDFGGKIFLVNRDGEVVGVEVEVRVRGDVLELSFGGVLDEGFYRIVFGEGSLLTLDGEELREIFLSNELRWSEEIFEGEQLVSVATEVIEDNEGGGLLLGTGETGVDLGWV